MQWLQISDSRERVSDFSLDFREIRPLADFGVRRENDLRGAGYAWTPVLVSFFKLLEVGFLPTWVLFPFFSTFRCFGWFEAMRGRLIGPKAWDRIDLNLLKPKVETVVATGCWVF